MLTGPSNFGLPLSGPLYRASLLLGLQRPLLGEQILAEIPPGIVAFELLVIGLSVGVIFFGLTTILRRRDIFAVQLGLQAAAVLCTGPLVWDGFVSYARVLSLLYLAFGLSWLTAPPDSLLLGWWRRLVYSSDRAGLAAHLSAGLRHPS